MKKFRVKINHENYRTYETVIEAENYEKARDIAFATRANITSKEELLKSESFQDWIGGVTELPIKTFRVPLTYIGTGEYIINAYTEEEAIAEARTKLAGQVSFDHDCYNMSVLRVGIVDVPTEDTPTECPECNQEREWK